MKIIKIILIILSLSKSLHVEGAPQKRLIDYGSNSYSQFGEDGIIKKIFEIIGTESKVAVEFGAWDGFAFSNTAALWSKDLAWKAILIEGDEKKFKDLKKNTKSFNVVPINAWVGIGNEDSLESILKNHNINQPIDLLSIDIDGNDYHILESLKTIRPRLIIVEYNPTIPVEFDLYAPYARDNNFGQSVGALNRIATKKGYKLIALTLTNAFYILEKDFSKFAEFETDLSALDVNDGHIVLVTTYDGKYVLVNNKRNNYFYGVDDEYEGELRGQFNKWDGSRISALYQVKNSK